MTEIPGMSTKLQQNVSLQIAKTLPRLPLQNKYDFVIKFQGILKTIPHFQMWKFSEND